MLEDGPALQKANHDFSTFTVSESINGDMKPEANPGDRRPCPSNGGIPIANNRVVKLSHENDNCALPKVQLWIKPPPPKSSSGSAPVRSNMLEDLAAP